MIVVDIETSGNFDPNRHGIFEIGAVEFGNPSNVFLQDCRIDDEDLTEKGSLIVTGKTEGQLRDKEKQSQKQMLENFFNWISKITNKTIVAHNTPFDYGFLIMKAKKYGLSVPFQYRSFDLHVMAQMKHFELNGEFLIENTKSAMNLPRVMEMCGMQDERIQLVGHEVVKEGKPHNALEDAKLEAECISRILYGKGMFSEFEKFEIPSILRKD